MTFRAEKIFSYLRCLEAGHSPPQIRPQKLDKTQFGQNYPADTSSPPMHPMVLRYGPKADSHRQTQWDRC